MHNLYKVSLDHEQSEPRLAVAKAENDARLKLRKNHS